MYRAATRRLLSGGYRGGGGTVGWGSGGGGGFRGVELDGVHRGAVDEGLDDEVEVGLPAGNRGAEVAVGAW
jgi:hypothetical protein